MANKKTKRDYFEELRGIVGDNEELCNFIDHELTLLANKHKSSGLTATQKANNEIIDQLLEKFQENKAQLYTISELIANFDFLNGLSNQKVSALLKKLVDSKQIERIKDKKMTYYKAI